MSQSARKGSETDMPVYICPATGARLEPHGGELRAGADGPAYEVRRGIPILLSSDAHLDEGEAAQFRRLNEAAIRDGWRKAVEGHFSDEYSVRYVTSESRHRILDLLDLTGEDVVLDLGASLGTFTVELGRRAKQVYAIDIVPGQAEFAAERCRQEGLENVTVACGGDRCRLPYADGLFDAVFFNLVFEWCSWRDEGEQFLAGQRRILAEIRRVLKPGGRMLLTTKNRFALHYLLGKPDEHVQGMRFGNALPRWMMRALYKRKTKGALSFHGLLHSHNALRKLIEDAGFEGPQSYWAAPEMRFPRDYIPTDAASIKAARSRPDFVQGYSRLTRLLMPLIPASRVKHFTPGLTFLARTPR